MKRMLFNATNHEEIRVAIVDGQKLIDLDIESFGREQRKGNIYKGIITRIEPGLEACFVNYGETRHGFLPFKEITKIYFQKNLDIKNPKIQEVLIEGQDIIVQVEKEERGNKGAALTTFISLAGRYLVLMPNNPRGGGISRRLEGAERQEIKDLIEKLNIPQGMSIIARTAGIGRNLEELEWDLSYLIQLWNAIEKAALDNKSPVLIYLESSLVIRAIRDYFSPDINEILVDKVEIAEQAKSFMSLVMPDSANKIHIYSDDIPLFSRFQIEHQIETAYSDSVQLPSGGSIVIDKTEALVAIDVNSAKSTRGSDIEETALRTNLEATEEVARQLRLRDLGGLIVIDFIDMEENKNQRAVEHKLKDSLSLDRARVQMGKISKFGLIELSRQRLKPSLIEGSHIKCPRCNGIGIIRDAESSSLQVLRLVQEEAMKDGTAIVHVYIPLDVAAYLLNEKRADISAIENKLSVNLLFIPSKQLETPHYKIERIKHDDPYLDNIKTSSELINSANNLLKDNKKNDIKYQQEALVKSINHLKQAPINKSKSIFIQKIKNVFSFITRKKSVNCNNTGISNINKNNSDINHIENIKHSASNISEHDKKSYKNYINNSNILVKNNNETKSNKYKYIRNNLASKQSASLNKDKDEKFENFIDDKIENIIPKNNINNYEENSKLNKSNIIETDKKIKKHKNKINKNKVDIEKNLNKKNYFNNKKKSVNNESESNLILNNNDINTVKESIENFNQDSLKSIENEIVNTKKDEKINKNLKMIETKITSDNENLIEKQTIILGRPRKQKNKNINQSDKFIQIETLNK
ncbi:Ribonuclease E [Candidatus Kinetoplastibacterium sorsogonicusi]|uniref:Ribonuclease G n=1 Tax=Candidatus Kinetoplastidibacterium kentomonadis TaxID=1576550 RepID=A0A3S7JA67_9PROT|nr:Rne/Rng family ribonuclease [Candidatus Kinetoplastibacterium sorsogonicusi]AWD32563.1 Ribonuclease E [Candidatus Kinetoplastibacterium sorsogonicusi]